MQCDPAWLVMIGLLAGCVPTAHDLPPAPETLNSPAAPAVATAPAAYLVQVGDVLGVRLYTAPELNEEITVRPDGRVTTTLAQSVQAAGRTPDEIAGDLRRTYEVELRDPRLTVEVKTASPHGSDRSKSPPRSASTARATGQSPPHPVPAPRPP